MRNISFAIATLAFVGMGFVASAQTDDVRTGPLPEFVVANCVVSVIQDVDVPAMMNGPIARIDAHAGDLVEKGQILATVDERRMQAERDVANARHLEAIEAAESESGVEEARIAMEIAELSYQARVKANERLEDAIPADEMRRYRLEFERSRHQLDQRRTDRSIAGLSAQTRGAELRSAELEMELCKIKSPVRGVIIETQVDAGEWVTAGDTILRLVQLDKLHVQGILSGEFDDTKPYKGRKVIVTVGGRGSERHFDGTVLFVSPIVQANGGRRIQVEVLNKVVDGVWQLKAGQSATITSAPAAKSRTASR